MGGECIVAREDARRMRASTKSRGAHPVDVGRRHWPAVRARPCGQRGRQPEVTWERGDTHGLWPTGGVNNSVLVGQEMRA
eukprot:2921392-Prymnesium_polylepis.1